MLLPRFFRGRSRTKRETDTRLAAIATAAHVGRMTEAERRVAMFRPVDMDVSADVSGYADSGVLPADETRRG
jgi:hypothetical protein